VDTVREEALVLDMVATVALVYVVAAAAVAAKRA
jgi:hypothetical protein